MYLKIIKFLKGQFILKFDGNQYLYQISEILKKYLKAKFFNFLWQKPDLYIQKSFYEKKILCHR